MPEHGHGDPGPAYGAAGAGYGAGGSGYSAAESVDEPDQPTLVGVPVPDPAAGPWQESWLRDRLPGGRVRDGRLSGGTWAAVAAGGILLVALLGALVGGVLSGSAPASPPTTRSAHTARLVTVDAASMIGQPVRQVRSQLAGMGLRVQVLWQPGHQPPGTVVSVVPGGQVQAGSVVVVTGVLHQQPPGHDKHHGNGDGNGQGNGD